MRADSLNTENWTRPGDPHRGPTGLTAATVVMATRGSPRRSPRPRRWGQSQEGGSGGSGGLEPDALSGFSSAVSAVSAVNPTPPLGGATGGPKGGDRRGVSNTEDPIMGIAVRHLSKRYGTFQAVDDVSFEVPTGQLVALLGPSGSGKSTILRIIAGLETPELGTVELDG